MVCSEGIEDILITDAGTNRGSNVMAPEHAIEVEPLLITRTTPRLTYGLHSDRYDAKSASLKSQSIVIS